MAIGPDPWASHWNYSKPACRSCQGRWCLLRLRSRVFAAELGSPNMPGQSWGRSRNTGCGCTACYAFVAPHVSPPDCEDCSGMTVRVSRE
eukprot:10447243-Alexandrium_andersonii.AAC.1